MLANKVLLKTSIRLAIYYTFVISLLRFSAKALTLFSLLISIIIAELDLAKVFRRRSKEIIKTLDQVYTSFSSILITFLDREKLFILHITNTIYIIIIDYYYLNNL